VNDVDREIWNSIGKIFRPKKRKKQDAWEDGKVSCPVIFTFFEPWSSIWHETICNRRITETSCSLLVTKTWLLRLDTSLGAAVRQMFKYQVWIGRCLVCIICYPRVMYTRKSEQSNQSQSVSNHFLKRLLFKTRSFMICNPRQIL